MERGTSCCTSTMVPNIYVIIATAVAFLMTRLLYVIYRSNKPLCRSSVQPLSTLIILGSGGHTAEMINLLSVLNMDRFTPRSYIAAATDNMSLQKARVLESSLADKSGVTQSAQFLQIYRSREVGQSYLTSVGTTIIAIGHALWLMIKISPQVILCNGPGTCIPLCAIAFLFKVCILLSLESEEIPKLKIEHPSLSLDQIPNLCSNDQTEELEAMVDAIAAASQREAEAHETAYKWSRENEELRMKIKVLIDDNNKLIELYQKAVSDGESKSSDKDQNCQKSETGHQQNHFNVLLEEKELALKHEVENLEQQLTEMHEENEKLMVLYEKAMQERDEFKRKLALEAQNDDFKGDFGCLEKLVEVDRGESHITPKSPDLEMENLNFENLNLSDEINSISKEIDLPVLEEQDEDSHHDAAAELDDVDNSSDMDLTSPNPTTEKVSQELHLVRIKLNAAEEKLGSLDMEVTSPNPTTGKASQELDLVRMKLNAAEEKIASSLETIGLFGTVKEAITEVDSLSREIEKLEDAIKEKQQENLSLETLSSEINERAVVGDRKLMALKYSLSSFSSSVAYFEQREIQARTKVDSSLAYLIRKKAQFVCLEDKKKEYLEAQRRFQVFENESTNNIAELTLKLQEKQDSEKVLFAIDNLEKAVTGKATELLKSQEEKTKIQLEIKQTREKLMVKTKQNKELDNKVKKLEKESEKIHMEIEKA